MHELTFDFRGGVLLARCACGGWERQAPLGSEGVGATVAAVERLERDHGHHALCQAPAPGPPPSPP